MLRDVLIDAHPINWIGDLNYLYVIFIAVFLTFLFKSKILPLSKTLFLFDTVGISVFTLLGLQKGLNFEQTINIRNWLYIDHLNLFFITESAPFL